LLSRDLIFTSKITGTARALGYHVSVAGNATEASALMEQFRPRVVFVDLAAGDLVGTGALLSYQKLTGAGTSFIAFGSHVDSETLARAQAAGCTEVMPRSKFSANLPEIIRSYFQTGESPK
jgi:CheY-like chemotaxis protein